MYLLSILFGFCQMVLLGYILYKEANRKSPAVFLWGTLMIMFGVPHFISCITESKIYSNTILLEASVFVVAFSLLYVLFRTKKTLNFTQNIGNNNFIIHETDIIGSALENICFIIFLIAIISYMWHTINSVGGLFNTSWGALHGLKESYISWFGLANRLILAFSGFTLYFYLTKRKIKTAVVLVLFLLLIIVTRNRVQMLPLFIFFLSLCLIKIEKIKFKHFLLSILFACVVVYIVYAVRAIRWLGSLSEIMINFSWGYLNETILTFLEDNNGELGLRQYFYFFIDQDNEFEGFNKGYTLLRILLVYIPSQFSMGLKPQSFDLYMGQAVGLSAGGSMHPTLFGDCFGNLYWFGILFGIFWSLFANFIDWLISRQKYDFFKILYFFLASYSFVVIGRGSVSNGIDPTAWGILILSIIKMLFLKLKSVHLAFGKKGLT